MLMYSSFFLLCVVLFNVKAPPPTRGRMLNRWDAAQTWNEEELQQFAACSQSD